MTDQVISPLRRRMIEDMSIRKLAQLAQFGVERGSQFVAAGVMDQEVKGLRERIWACSANQGYFLAAASQI
jgi:hypothetical protein